MASLGWLGEALLRSIQAIVLSFPERHEPGPSDTLLEEKGRGMSTESPIYWLGAVLYIGSGLCFPRPGIRLLH